ncbi:unnamed protein product, partial [marine sediment metagenome]
MEIFSHLTFSLILSSDKGTISFPSIKILPPMISPGVGTIFINPKTVVVLPHPDSQPG